MSKKMTADELREAQDAMREWAPKGATLYTSVVWVNREGSARDLRVFALYSDRDGLPAIADVTYRAAQACGENVRDRDGHRVWKVYGGGMDMGFSAVYNLGLALYGDGYALSQRWL